MSEIRVGTRELKNKLSEYIRRVKKGQTVIVTERGNVVAQITPPQQTIEERLRAMVDAGLAEWSGKKLKPHTPKIINKSGKLISDLILEDRR
jgi:prevent-host-death family protein